MNKILSVGIIAIVMLVTISYATAKNDTYISKKESPLYKIRTERAISEKIERILDSIKTKFLGNRIFLIPSFKIFSSDGSGNMRIISLDTPTCHLNICTYDNPNCPTGFILYCKPYTYGINCP
jgi:hypothetical protein